LSISTHEAAKQTDINNRHKRALQLRTKSLSNRIFDSSDRRL